MRRSEPGRNFADIRIAHRQFLRYKIYYFDMLEGKYDVDHSYGVRACVAEHWGMAYDTVLTPERVQATAQRAVAAARTLSGADAG